MTNNGIGVDDCNGRSSEPTASTFSNDDDDADLELNAGSMGRKQNSPTKNHHAALESPPSNGSSLRVTPTSTSTKVTRKNTFNSDFVTPGAIADEENPDDVSRRASVSSMRSKPKENLENKKSLGKSKQKRAVSADNHPVHDENRKRTNQSQVSPQNGTMHLNNQAQLEKFREAFLIFDRNGDGRITTDEITRAMQSLGYNPNDDEISDMLHRADINQNGTIEFEEFIQVMNDYLMTNGGSGRSSLGHELQAMFEIFDLNKDGRITAQELSHVMSTLGENLSNTELEDMMRTADSNGDGIIDFQEFQNLFQMYDQSFSGSSESSMVVSSH